MQKLLCLLVVSLFWSCAAEPQPDDVEAAGAPAVESLSLPGCYTNNARQQAAADASRIMFDLGGQYFCQDNGATWNCYDGPSPYYGRRWFFLQWGTGVGSPVRSQSGGLYVPAGSTPAVRTYNFQCSCTSCTFHRLVP